MKRMKHFWDNRSDYEKAVLGLTLAFAVFCLGYFSNWLYLGSRCDVCSQTLKEGEHYILDVRTGEIQPISDFVDRNFEICWFSGVSWLPQEISSSLRRGYMRFPRQAPRTARYCANHTANLDADFLMLSPVEDATVCRAILPGQNLDPDGRVITARLNDKLNCWELEIGWDRKDMRSPVRWTGPEFVMGRCSGRR